MAHANQTVSNEKILSLFRAADAPYVTASELAEELPISRQAVHKRLLQLHDDGVIERKKTGRTVGWWLSRAGG